MKPTTATLTLFVAAGKASGKPCTRRDVSRFDEAILNGSVDLAHGSDYAVNSTTWSAPRLDGDWIVAEVEVEVEAYADKPMTADDLAQVVENDVGCFAPDAFEVVSVHVETIA